VTGTEHPVLDAFGWNERVAVHLPTTEIPARVTRVDRDRAAAITEAGEVTVVGRPLPAVGDWIALAPTARSDGAHGIARVAPRWSEITRLDPTSYSHDIDVSQVLAANVDLVGITAPLDRPLSVARIERESVIAWEAGAHPIVVLTKADRHDDADRAAAELGERLLGTDVLVTAAIDGTGIDAVAQLLRPDRTALLLGASGAGKSTLTNALLGEERLETGGVRRLDHRGRHTTTARHLLAVPGGGVLIDTPGIRSVGLAGSGDGMAAAFVDIDELANACRFADCAHDREPGCAVRQAVDDGLLDRDRLASWHKLQREFAAHERRSDPRAAAEHRAEVRRFSRELRRNTGRNRP
jgi:ribosome biogenesis GTPase